MSEYDIVALIGWFIGLLQGAWQYSLYVQWKNQKDDK